MDAALLPVGVMCSLGLAGVALSFAAIFHVRGSMRLFDRRAKARQAHLEAAVEEAKQTVDGLAAEIHQIQEQQPATAVPRSGFNLSTRSQALRMNRRGDNPGQIAAALQVPLQEVDLLLKVHRIVLQNLIVTARPEAAAGPRYAAARYPVAAPDGA